MKVLLLQDVRSLGRKGDLVDVKPGYARPFLFPKKWAVPADANALRRQEKLQKERQEQAKEDRKKAELFAAELAKITLTIPVKADAEGHLFGSVSAADIVQSLKVQSQMELERHSVNLKRPIKKLGVYTIEIRLPEEVAASIQLKVVSEEEVAAS